MDTITASHQGYMTEERKMLQQMARDFTNQEVLPVANKLDRVKGLIPEDLVKKMGELGFFGIKLPEQYGGLGLGAFEYCMVAEELSRGWMSVGSLIARTNTIMGFDAMSEEQRMELIPKMASGEYICAGALSEPDVGSDLAGIKCRAWKDGNEWVIQGSKYWCTYGDQADAIFIAVRTNPEIDPNKRHKGISLLKIEKERGGFPEGIVGTSIPKIGYYGFKTWEIAFDNFRVPLDALVGEEGKAFYYLGSGLEVARAHTAARSIGQAQGAFDVAKQYAQERIQFGQPIAHFQDLRFKLAKMATDIEAARQLMYHVCTQIDSGKRCDTEAAMVKYYAAEMSERVTSDALQILGGAGYTNEFPVERYWRDARLTKIFEGTSEIQLRIISDKILGKIPK